MRLTTIVYHSAKIHKIYANLSSCNKLQDFNPKLDNKIVMEHTLFNKIEEEPNPLTRKSIITNRISVISNYCFVFLVYTNEKGLYKLFCKTKKRILI